MTYVMWIIYSATKLSPTMSRMRWDNSPPNRTSLPSLTYVYEISAAGNLYRHLSTVQNHSNTFPVWYLKLVHSRFLPHPFLFITIGRNITWITLCSNERTRNQCINHVANLTVHFRVAVILITQQVRPFKWLFIYLGKRPSAFRSAWWAASRCASCASSKNCCKLVHS
jgi:hypothetical protein